MRLKTALIALASAAAVAACLLAAQRVPDARATPGFSRQQNRERPPDLAVAPPTQLGVVSGAGPGEYALTFDDVVENLASTYAGELFVVGRRSSPSGQLMSADQYVDAVDPASGNVTSQQVIAGVGTMRYHRSWHLRRFVAFALQPVSGGGASSTFGVEFGACLASRYQVDDPGLRSADHRARGDRASSASGQLITRADVTPLCGARKPGLKKVVEAIDAGNGDPLGQLSLDITHVPDGRYLLLARVNPERSLVESNYRDDAASVLLSITRAAAGDRPTVRVLKSCPFTSSCTQPTPSSGCPTVNGLGAMTPGTPVARGLRVIALELGSSDCSTPVISARSADGTLWVRNFDNLLWKSTDGLRTLQPVYRASGYSETDNVIPLASGTILLVVQDSGGQEHILRSTDSSGTAFSSTPVLNLPPGSSLHDSESWAQIGNEIFIGQYGAGPPVDLWRSTDDGRSFQVVWQGTDVGEIHAVMADPYVPGRLWITLDGDEVGNVGASRVGYSDDGGSTFTWIPRGHYPQNRVLTLMFDSDAVYFGCDCPDRPGALYRYDRRSGRVTTLMSNLNGPFYDSVGFNGQLAQFSAVEPKGYVGDQYIHILTNGDGTSWSLTRTPWIRDGSRPASYAMPLGSTFPDRHGRFWMSYYDLSNSDGGVSDIEFQFDPSASVDGVRSSFGFSPDPIVTGQPVLFDGSASSSPASALDYMWRFGDGSTASGRTASHVYGSGGPFTASLEVQDADRDAALSTRTVAASASRPTATTGAASARMTSATLYASAQPGGSIANVYFQYGPDSSYGWVSGATQLPAGQQPQPFTAAISGLKPDRVYHFRAVASNGSGTSYGIDRTFVTP